MTEYVSCPWLELDGRLGNSLFQIAGTVGVARSLGAEPAFPRWTYQDIFRVPREWFWPTRDSLPGRAVNTLVPHLPGRAARYLQDPALFANVADEIREAFRFAPGAQAVINHEWFQLTRLLPAPYVGVHVRRGDNVTNEPGTINCLPESYYRDALTSYQGRRGARGWPTALVFSDDPAWCEETKLGAVYHGKPRAKEGEPGYWSEGAVDWIDLGLFAKCAGHVISNSTYAWWGAWLSGDERPIFPGYWYGDQIRAMGLDESLLFPAGWERIEVEDPAPMEVPA